MPEKLPEGVTVAVDDWFYETFPTMKKNENFFKVERAPECHLISNGILVKPLWGTEIKIGDSKNDLNPEILEAKFSTKHTFESMGYDNLVSFANALQSLNYNIMKVSQSTGRKFPELKLRKCVEEILYPDLSITIS